VAPAGLVATDTPKPHSSRGRVTHSSVTDNLAARLE
jgi:hypothetical protein